ncbi:MAG: phosphoribosyl-AMP cyclohydrolase [Verrucomicrobiales bacterium]
MSAEKTTIRFGERGDAKAVEEDLVFAPKFDAQGLIPAIATDSSSGEVLMVAYMNAESIARTLELGEAVYWSRSRSCLWHKGATSGHIQKIVEILVDCDQDALVLVVEPLGPGSCHTGHRSCFYRRLPNRAERAEAGESGDAPIALLKTESTRSFDPDSVYGK